ncbi:hypothetical protein V9T40_006492 [Parthenolecanium corni]|uniref:Inter-alpha-trypsin inhibitor heavy chain H4-like n=1 Tax=Parthenolecanium corni TaxID=536013 RepID=A0AAN9TMC7_9HEMI
MLSSIKVAIFLWPLLLTPSVISRSFVTKVSEQQHFWKRDVAAVETNSTKPDIYSFDITSNITYRYAVTTVSSRVANPANTSKEISFHVTLPESAFISKFLMVIKDKVYEAYVKEKEEAKKDYQEAVDHGFTAGLVSMNTRDSNVFTVSVNVEANGKVTFNLTYEQLLTRTLGQYENIINVNPGQVIKTFNVHVNIEESSNITSLQVSDLKTGNEIDSNNTKSIDAKIDRPAGESARIAWSPDGKTQEELSADGVNGQFIVRYDVDHTSHPNQILVDEGYFVHFYSPTDLKTLPKHVLFVLDISGSMGGRKIEQLREALTLILADIGKGDYFSILLFSDAVQLWTLNGTVGDASPPIIYDEVSTTTAPEVEINHRFIVPATPEHIKKATEFAKTLQETGGTNIIAAIRKSLEIAKWGQKQPSIKAKPLIIFLTDGQPNVEMSDPEEINKNVNKLNSDKYPIFSLAFGQGADFEFLRKLSLSNAGFARNIYVASDTTLQLKNFYKEVASPLLSNVTFEYVPGQIAEGYVTKRVFNNLYNGSELVVAGKLSNNTKGLGGNLTYEGVDGFFCIPLPTPFDIPAQNPRAHLEKLFAYMYIKELLDKDLISDDKNSTYKQKALKLSLEYGFVTPLTSLVVVKPNETDSGASIKNANALPSETVPASMQFAPAGKLIHNLYEIILRLRSSRYTNNF